MSSWALREFFERNGKKFIDVSRVELDLRQLNLFSGRGKKFSVSDRARGLDIDAGGEKRGV